MMNDRQSAMMQIMDLARKVRCIVDDIELNLSGCRVLTEAATGAYAVTPVIAATAGATVTALAKSSRHGSADDARRQIVELAQQLGVTQQIQIVEELAATDVGRADVVTNSGHLRPLDAAFVEQMKPGAVIPLMYESWELRPGEVDLESCRRRGIGVAGTNECHPKLRVFDYLGMLAVSGLLKCRVPVALSKILLICDNAFAPHIAQTLLGCQAELEILDDGRVPPIPGAVRRSADLPGAYDAVVVASTPGFQAVVGCSSQAKYNLHQIGSFSVLVQLWGDVERGCLDNVACYPINEPAEGHMGILLSELGPDPIVRLQAGGLKVGEILSRNDLTAENVGYLQRMKGI
jgi:hypothetical protein